VQFLRTDQLQARRIENYSPPISATCHAQNAPEVRMPAVLGGDLEGLQRGVAGDLAQPPNTYTQKPADSFSYGRVRRAAGFQIPAVNNKFLRVSLSATQRDENSNGNESPKCCAEFHIISIRLWTVLLPGRS
jgi:hypothetical protein